MKGTPTRAGHEALLERIQRQFSSSMLLLYRHPE